MAKYEYINWTSNTPLSADRLSQMSENEQHLKDLHTEGPQGVLAFSWSTNIRNAKVGHRDPIDYSSNLDTTFTVGENRLIRATFHQTGARCTSSSGTHELHTKLLLDDERTWGYRYDVLHGRIRAGTPDVVRVGTLTAGEHTVKPQFVIFGGSLPNYFQMLGWPNDPMYVLIEDLGPRDGENIA